MLQAFSWRSLEDINTIIIPFLASEIGIAQSVISSSSNATAVADATQKVAQLGEAKKGWEGLIARNEQLYQAAKNGKLKAVTQLVADALLQNEQKIDNVTFINGTKAASASALRQFNAIRLGLFCVFELCRLFDCCACEQLWRSGRHDRIQ